MEVSAPVNVGELRANFERELAAISSPLVAQLGTIDELIAERLADLKALREVRLQLVHALRPLVGDDAIPLEPGRNAKAGPKPKSSTTRANHTRVSDEKIALALEWARSQNGDGWTARDLREGMGPDVSRSSGEAVVRALREREQIRVVSPHRGPTHPARYLAVT